MKQTLTFSTKVEHVNWHDVTNVRANVGWALEIGRNDEGIVSMETKLLNITFVGKDGAGEQYPLEGKKVDFVHDYCLGTDKSLKPREVIIHDLGVQINF